MTAGDRYDTIGTTYSSTRRPDPRIADQIHRCLGDGRRIVNVGAGSGSYEPDDRDVVAIEPSWQMIGQRPSGTRTVRGVGERLPVRDGAFDVAMAVLTVHHWADPAGGLRELRRVSGRQVVFFFESLAAHSFWALDYFPAALDLPTERDPPGEDLLRSMLDVRSVEVVPIPHDCIDGFGAAFWRRPEAYADPQVQAGMSWLAMLSEDDRRRGGEHLLADLASGRWDEQYGRLRELDVFDGGYRIAVAGRHAA